MLSFNLSLKIFLVDRAPCSQLQFLGQSTNFPNNLVGSTISKKMFLKSSGHSLAYATCVDEPNPLLQTVHPYVLGYIGEPCYPRQLINAPSTLLKWHPYTLVECLLIPF